MTRATGRPTRVAEPTWFRLLLAGGVLLGVVATVLVVVSEEARWLRLAVLAALWAALLAAFAVARARREARVAELKQEEGKRTYELELQREITARREYEAKVIEHARQDSDDRHREELAALREQLDKLTQTLSGLLDGDLLVERLTLSAESTRVRQLGGDRGRLIGAPTGIGQGMGPYPQRPLAPPPPPQPRPVPAPAEAEDDTVQINLTKLTEHARAVQAGTTAADTALPDAGAVVEAEPLVDAEPEVEVQPVVEESVEQAVPDVVVEETPIADSASEESTVEVPGVVGPAVDEPVVDEPVAEAAAVVEVVELEPAVDETVVEAEPAGDAEPGVEAGSDEAVSEDAVSGDAELVADEPVAVGEPEAVPATQDETADPEPEVAAAAEDNHHNAGVSVSDLLAAYGISSERRPRRRRAADDDE